MSDLLAQKWGRWLTALAVVAAADAARGDAMGQVKIQAGFTVELVYQVPPTQGSWVSLAVDERGRLIASDQEGGLYRLEPSALGADAAGAKVTPIPMNIGHAQGLLCHDGKLYLVLNGEVGSFASGLYRLSDSNNDDQYDRLEQLRLLKGSGEHGPHAVVLGPDAKSLYLVAGNFTALPRYDRTAVPPHWAEDQLLPRIYDPMGHANEILAPAGWVARTDLDGNDFEVLSIGYRNSYDLAFNADGELFTFDSDMEWDVGTPWYRPTRILHVTRGSDYGWRCGNGVWPVYYPDTLPSSVDVGPGSPTGLTFGYGAKFPERYQQALFAGDWSYGNIYAIHLTPHGSSYRGVVERFASAMPLAVTDMVVRPQDGALYFAVGGRESASAVYRIVHTGEAPTAESAGAPADAPRLEPPSAEAVAAAARARQVRHGLDAYQGPAPSAALDALWPHLSNPDRFTQYAARTALERQPWKAWHARAASEPNPRARVTALLALARTAPGAAQAEWAQALGGVAMAGAPKDLQLAAIRTAAVGVVRWELLAPETRQRLLDQFNPLYPTGDRELDCELAKLLVRLKAPNIVERVLAQLEHATTQEDGIELAITLSAVKAGWTPEQRTRLLDWFDASAQTGGGLSCFGYIVGARDRFIEAIPSQDRRPIEQRISKPLLEATEKINVAARPFVRAWKLDEVLELVERSTGVRDFENGRRMFAAASCYRCHRVNGAGSVVGPDLTGVGGRFGVRDLMRSIVEPSAVISDQYQQMVYEANGKSYVGRVTNISGAKISISTDMLNPKMTVDVPRDEIEAEHPSDVSVMPAGLLDTLSADEVLDLVAFLRAGGRATHELYQAAPAGQPGSQAGAGATAESGGR